MRSTGLMKDRRVFARPPQPRRSWVDGVALVTMTADLLRQGPSLKDGHVRVAGVAAPVFADGEMLKIVFQNLLLNSGHAPGIPEEVRDTSFTAFFTTKTRGSGLGLATATRLIEAHQGAIDVTCPADRWHRVTVRLPTDRTA